MARFEAAARVIGNCGTVEHQPPLTEPHVITSTFLTGGVFEVTESAVRLVGWEEIATVNGEMAERRIVSRLVMTNTTAREVLSALQTALAKGGH
ncbi:MAG: hypothetical protein ACOZAM_15800 [Pseudomonadota bacterium]